jgi:hypothetical protein
VAVSIRFEASFNNRVPGPRKWWRAASADIKPQGVSHDGASVVLLVQVDSRSLELQNDVANQSDPATPEALRSGDELNYGHVNWIFCGRATRVRVAAVPRWLSNWRRLPQIGC